MIDSIGIIGDGKMGTDLFNYLIDFDFKVIWICYSNEQKQILQDKFFKKINRMLKNKLINENDYKNKSENTIISNKNTHLKNTDIIIEAITENIEDKKKIFNEIDDLINKNCIFTSNSSSIIPSKICPDSPRKKKFLGLHFFYPVKLKNICEIIKSQFTDDRSVNIISQFLQKINKHFIILNEDNGSILNRIFLDFQTEAFNICQEKKFGFHKIDELIKTEIFPIGVFEMFDSIGIDTMYYSINQYLEGIEDKSFYEPLLTCLKKMIEMNKLGIKTRSGFYSYEKKNEQTETNINDNEEYKSEVILRLKILYLNSVFNTIEKKILSEEEVEFSIKEYMDLKKGPIELAYEMGIDNIYIHLLNFYKKTGFKSYFPSLLFKK